MKQRIRRPSWAVLIWGVIGLFYGSLLLGHVWDSFTPDVELGQDEATVVAIMGEPTEKHREEETVDGRKVDTATVQVYRYSFPGPSSGDTEVHFKNGKVVAIWRH